MFLHWDLEYLLVCLAPRAHFTLLVPFTRESSGSPSIYLLLSSSAELSIPLELPALSLGLVEPTMTITAILSPSWDPIVWKRGASSLWFGTFLSDKSLCPLGDDPHSSCYHQDRFLSHPCPFLPPHMFSAPSWSFLFFAPRSCLLSVPLLGSLEPATSSLYPFRPAWYWNPFWGRVPICNPCFFCFLASSWSLLEPSLVVEFLFLTLSLFLFGPRDCIKF